MRPDTGDQLRLVTGMDVPEAVLGGQPLAVLARLVEVAAALDDLGAERADRSHLRGVRPLRDADRDVDAEAPSGVGQRLAVVPGRGSDEPLAPLLLGELRDEVHAAAHLERAGRQVVLVLDAHLRAEKLGEPRVRVERRAGKVRPDSPRRGTHVAERRGGHRRRARLHAPKLLDGQRPLHDRPSHDPAACRG